jgi:hypothetical protein
MRKSMTQTGRVGSPYQDLGVGSYDSKVKNIVKYTVQRQDEKLKLLHGNNGGTLIDFLL